MADLQVKSFDQIVSEQAVAAQAEAGDKGLSFSVGSVFRALAEGFATIGLWLQTQALRILANTRAATSRGADLDSWMGDYFLTRAPAAPAQTEVTFSRFTPTLPALVPVGASVKTSDGLQTFTVIANTQHFAWDGSRNGYTVPPGVLHMTVPARADSPGRAGNVSAGSITLMASTVPAMDTVSNPVPGSGGADAETDDALRARFRAYIGALPRATRAAVDYAIGGVQAGLSWSILERMRPDGSTAEAFFTVVVDNGTGSPPALLLAEVAAAVEAVRGLGIQYAVVAPQVVVANVTMTLTVDPSADRPAVVGKVAEALRSYINGIPLGQALSYSRLTQVAYSASPYVQNVTAVILNGGTADIPGEPRRAIRAGTVAVS
jgi:uncharacterized phage protein gp47/JayE